MESQCDFGFGTIVGGSDETIQKEKTERRYTTSEYYFDNTVGVVVTAQLYNR
jgi:hypothetical protein